VTMLAGDEEKRERLVVVALALLGEIFHGPPRLEEEKPDRSHLLADASRAAVLSHVGAKALSCAEGAGGVTMLAGDEEKRERLVVVALALLVSTVRALFLAVSQTLTRRSSAQQGKRDYDKAFP
jgi:hypothetical protein